MLFNKNVYFLSISVLLFVTSLNAQGPKLPFDIDQGVGQLQYHSHLTESRENEFLIDTNIIYVPARRGQKYPKIAFDGINYLIMWLDNRTSNQYDIIGARIDQSGVVLDPGGIGISAIKSYKFWPSMGFGGSNYFVVWEDDRNSDMDIYGTRVSPSGTILDPDGIVISTTNRDKHDPAVAFDGTNYLVVWVDPRNGSYDIYGARVNQSGVVLDPTGFAISTADDTQGDVEIIFDGANYFVVWDDNRNYSMSGADIYGARVDTSGTVFDTLGIAISTETGNQQCPAIAFDGTNYIIVWNDDRSGIDFDIYGARVSPLGVVLDTAGIAIFDANNWFPWFMSVAFDGTNYFVTCHSWSDSTEHDVYGTRVNTAGIVLDTAGIPISTLADWQFYPMVAFDGTNYMVIWEGGAYGGAFVDVFGARVNQSGIVLDTTEILISSQANSQEGQAVAFDGTNYLAVWEDYRNDPYYDLYFTDIYGTRVSPSGTILDPEGITIAQGVDYQVNSSVAFDGTNYLVVWDNGFAGIYDIYGTRVSQLGIVIDTTSIAVSSAVGTQRFSSVAFGDTNYLVAWQDERSGVYDIYGARIDPTGTVLDTSGIPISTATDKQEFPSIVYDGSNYLVTWQDYRSSFHYDIYGARVDQTGTVLDTAGIAISTAVIDQKYPSTAFDGTNFMVVWQDKRSGLEWDILGARVSQLGVVLDTAGILISAAPGNQTMPSVKFDDTNYIVVWQDDRSGYYSEDIYGAKLDTSGMVIDTFSVSLQTGAQTVPAIAHGNGNQLLITYSGWTDHINTHPANTMRICGKFYPCVGVEEDWQLKDQPAGLSLQIYPNPVRKHFNVRYILPQKTNINLSIYDVTGRLVKEIMNENQNVGIRTKTFDVADLSQGVYFVRINTEEYTTTKKVIIIK